MMRHHLTPLQIQKRSLRAEMRERRGSHQADGDACAALLADVFADGIALPKGAVVSTYSPVHREIDPVSLNDVLRDRGHTLALPIITGKGRPLIFREYEPGDQLLVNPLGIPEPVSTAQGTEPDVLLIPLLAFDASRNRLGYGGGYYDRTIKILRARKALLTIGLAYSFQETEHIPVGPNDVPLDMIVTELRIFGASQD